MRFFFGGMFSVEIYFDNNMPTDKVLQLLKLYARRCISKCAREVFGQTYTYRQHNDNAFENNRSKVIFFKSFYIYGETV